ncbi:UNVERIFIED_CONTAM: hypothetical protein FKN15_049550 [Acipenser sinensis]
MYPQLKLATPLRAPRDANAGEGCVALRCAEFCTTDFSTPLTHHGEHTGDFNGTIQLRTSESKQRQKTEW